MNGTPEKIDAAVADAIAILGRNGGYFCAPDQQLPFPTDNIEAFHAAVKRYGQFGG
jgi:hypothetical protein